MGLALRKPFCITQEELRKRTNMVGQLWDIQTVIKFMAQAISNDEPLTDERFSLEHEKDLANFMPMLEILWDKIEAVVKDVEKG